MISVIIPVYNEVHALPNLLSSLDRLEGEYEVLFSDGGSTDGTLELLAGRRMITGAKGRGAQCNRAAAEAQGDVFFFLHCDSTIPADALFHIRAAVDRGARWGCLTLRFDDTGFAYRFGGYMSNLRVRWGHIAFGDQGIFMTRALFEQVEGFPELPIMEDYELSLRLKGMKVFPVQVKSRIITSSRRFHEGGVFRVTWDMQRLRAMYRRGVDIGTISQAYRDVRKSNE
ncbi:TIGR04283 family arsenosugar biosynthesis glycosyltransferase [Desulfitobacterium sp. PCE1]|uniref:TIGR04283 family arsenosugar biosynthesis glycosyltransferase n=1 Tax=Desulfitobacterium sp. PCE1 TaxID=146907 RepID=UPI000380E23A|nr:TIGR04283 family arsenosugar biosynthesis glycosyltransferase [Desulfitobacterium sp. PCE1]